MSEAVKATAAEVADPALARWLLTDTVRRLAEADGREQKALAKAAGVSLATWKRWLGGAVLMGAPQVYAFMAALGYAHTATETLALLALAADARNHTVTSGPEWALSSAFNLLLSLERVSEQIRTYEVTVVPGLLQTPGYARAHLALLGVGSELEERVDVRRERQARLYGTTSPVRFAAIVDEAVLHRAPAEPGVMAEQLEHLLKLGVRPNVDLRVIPFGAGPYTTDGAGPFVLLDSARVGRRIVHVERPGANAYYETPSDTDRYARAWAHLESRALGQEESAGLIRRRLSTTPD